MLLSCENIELEVVDSLFEYDLVPLRFCISGKYFGTLESPTYLPSFLASLDYLLNDDFYYTESINSENYRNYFIEDNFDFIDNYMCTFEETFDDFSKRCARNKTHIFMTWQLHAYPFFSYPTNEKGKIISTAISLHAFKVIYNELTKWYKNMKTI